MRKSLVSIVALGLFLGAPAMAQSTTDEAATNQTTTQQQQQQQTTTQQQQQQQTGTLSDQQFQEMLSGYEERAELEGRIARAITADGDNVFVLVGPRNLEPDDSFEAQDSEIRDRFEEAGFTTVQVLGDARIARANLDEDHYIFAFTAGQLSRPGMQTGALTGETGTEAGQDDTQIGEMDRSELEQTDTETTTEMGQTDTEMQMDPESGTTAGQEQARADDAIGEETGGVTGGEPRTTMSEDETDLGQTETQMGETETQMGETEAQIGETETQMGETETQLSETETQLGETETQLGETETQMGQTETQMGQTETQMGQTGTDIGEDDTQVGEMDTDAETGQIGRALSEPDADRMASDLEGAGIQNADQLQGRVVRATSNGAPVFFLITPRDMSAEAEIDISEDEVRQKLQQADLQDIQFVDDAAIVRGDFQDDSVFVLAGDLMGRGTQQ